MSMFGNYEKYEIYANIKNFIRSKKDKQHSEILKELMEVVSSSIEHGIHEIENKTI